MTRLIMVATTSVSISSRFTSCKGNYLVTYIQNRDSHYEFLETHADELLSEMSEATACVGACKDTHWIQAAFTIALSNPAIIGSYDATKNHLTPHVPANTISGRSGYSISQVLTINWKFPRATGMLMSHIRVTMISLATFHAGLCLASRKKRSIWD